ncbi:MAG: hypothetical protein HZC43_00585 [Nitrosomonadales bacterium]|nr:hypothetical protein [Nitrosomonadales bacterium]
MLIGSFIHPVAIALQLLAIFWALRLIPLTGKAKAWLAFTAAFALMGARRVIELLEHIGVIQIEIGNAFDIMGEILALIISILVALGIYLIRGVFEERQQAQQKLQQQLDELLRFQKVTVGRELHMKELAEENAALRDRLAAAQPDETKS